MCITPVSSINRTDRHNITEIMLKVAVNTIEVTAWAGVTLHSIEVVFNILHMLQTKYYYLISVSK